MLFEDNFVQPVIGWLIDPVLKVRLVATAPRESYDFDQAVLVIGYDPKLSPDRLTEPRSDESRAMHLATSSFPHTSDELTIFESDQFAQLTTVDLEWGEPDDVLRLRVPYDSERMKLKIWGLVQASVPPISQFPEALMLYAIKSAVKLDQLRMVVIKDRFPKLKKIEVLIRSGVAQEVFGLDEPQSADFEPGWVRLASREIGQ